MMTLQDALDRLGIDYADEKVEKNVERALAAAERTLRGAVGERVHVLLPEDPRVTELTGIYLEDFYDNRGTNAKVAGATRALVNTLELQLRLELRRAEQTAGGAG